MYFLHRRAQHCILIQTHAYIIRKDLERRIHTRSTLAIRQSVQNLPIAPPRHVVPFVLPNLAHIGRKIENQGNELSRSCSLEWLSFSLAGKYQTRRCFSFARDFRSVSAISPIPAVFVLIRRVCIVWFFFLPFSLYSLVSLLQQA